MLSRKSLFVLSGIFAALAKEFQKLSQEYAEQAHASRQAGAPQWVQIENQLIEGKRVVGVLAKLTVLNREEIAKAMLEEVGDHLVDPPNPHIPSDGIIVGRRVEQGWPEISSKREGPDLSWIP